MEFFVQNCVPYSQNIKTASTESETWNDVSEYDVDPFPQRSFKQVGSPIFPITILLLSHAVIFLFLKILRRSSSAKKIALTEYFVG